MPAAPTGEAPRTVADSLTAGLAGSMITDTSRTQRTQRSVIMPNAT